MKPRIPAAAVARAALLGLAACALTASTAQAYGGPGSYDPRTKPSVFPGTSAEVHGWKGVGSGGYNAADGTPRWGGSQVLIAPRWVLSSQHTQLAPGGWYNGPTGDDAGVVATYKPTQAALAEAWGFPQNMGNGLADVSLSYLDRALPAPAGGFPKLLRDNVGIDLPGVLPGYVLWAGQGGTPGDQVPRVGWTTPNGLNAPGAAGAPSPGRVFIGDGDSGSTGLWYKNASATPVIAGVTTHAQQALTYAQSTPFTSRLVTVSGGQPTTVDAWMDAQFAKHPGPPTWTTLAQEGVNVAALKPPAARGIRVSWTGSGTATVKWDAPTTPVPTSGFRVTASPGDRVVTAAASATSANLTGLTIGTTYTFTVTPFNTNGDAPRGAKAPLAGLPTWGDTTVSDAAWVEPNSTRVLLQAPLALQTTPTVKLTTAGPGTFKVDYCADISWTPQPLTDGTLPQQYKLYAEGEEWTVDRTASGASWRELRDLPGGKQGVLHCGLDPDELVYFYVNTRDGLNERPYTLGTVHTQTGPAAGIPIPVTRTATATRVITESGTVDYCATMRWDPLPTIGGVAAKRSFFLWSNGSDAEVDDSLVEGTSVQQCNLHPNEAYTLSVRLTYEGIGLVPPPLSNTLTTPTGAANGTPLPAPTAVTTSSRAAMTTDGRVDYCATVRWTAPAPVDGFPVKAYGVFLLQGFFQLAASDEVPASTTSREFCGLPANTQFVATASAIYAGDDEEPRGVGASRGVLTPAGPAAGTLWPKSQITAVSTPATVAGRLCVTLTWDTPTVVTGYPVQSFTLLARSNSTLVLPPTTFGGSARTGQVCNVVRGVTYRATLYTSYGTNISPYVTRDFTVPTV